MPNYLLPAGRGGYLYQPEILQVLQKYQQLKVDWNDKTVLLTVANDITKVIQELPLNCIEIEEEPVEKINALNT